MLPNIVMALSEMCVCLQKLGSGWFIENMMPTLIPLLTSTQSFILFSTLSVRQRKALGRRNSLSRAPEAQNGLLFGGTRRSSWEAGTE